MLSPVVTERIEFSAMKEAFSHEALDGLLGELVLCKIPGFAIRASSFGNVSSTGSSEFDAILDDLTTGLAGAIGDPITVNSKDVVLAPDNQSKRGLHVDGGPADSQWNFRVHRTIEGSCDILLARSVVKPASVSPERDDERINKHFDQGLAETSHFEPRVVQIEEVGDGDLVVFTSVGPRPTWHKFITKDAPRLSLVSFLDNWAETDYSRL